MKYLELDTSLTKTFYSDADYKALVKEVEKAREVLESREGAGNDFLGWLDLPITFDSREVNRIKEAAGKICNHSDILLAVGIGGSYLGARSCVELFKPYFGNNGCEVIFVGNHISGSYMNELLDYIKDKDYSINVISKSGTTTEPAIAFRILEEALINKYGKEEAKHRIFATTDKAKGALKTLADTEGYETFVVPDDIGGRFSVLTPVGLLPIAASGVDIDLILEGAKEAYLDFSSNKDVRNNIAMEYALVRNLLYRQGRKFEILVNYEPRLAYFAEWWKQLFGESEGKDHKGIWPASANFTTDLHSLGQMIQDGERTMFETVIELENLNKDVEIKANENNLDGLNFLAGKTMNDVNHVATLGTRIAHYDGGVPNILIKLKELTPKSYGYLVYFFEYACAISAYTLGVNPFNQPGVEAYKKNMFALLGKPGYEDLKAELEKKLK